MGIKRKACLLFAFLSFFRNYADESANLLPLGKTKKNLVFRSLNRNFAANYR